MLSNFTVPSAHSKGKVSILLALVAASIVASFRRDWLSRSLGELASAANESAQRVSRLKSRLLPGIEELLDDVTRRGRPAAPSLEDPSQEVKALRELLRIGSSITEEQGVKSRTLQDRIVAAQERLKREHGVTQKAFCGYLGVAVRTFRSWIRRARKPKPTHSNAPKSPSRRKKKRKRGSRNEGRFDLTHTLPGVQAMADTSDLKVFDVPLKVISVQDPGARDERLWEGYSLDDHEDAEIVVRTLKEALEDPEGIQLIVDQGKPYVAKKTREACDEMGIEHQPAKEGTPTEKATLERSFHTVKEALKPLFDVTNRIAQAVPALQNTELARAAGRLLLSTFLSVYTLGARIRMRDERSSNREEVVRIVEEQRERANAEGRSCRVLLGRIHDEYQMEGARESFINSLRRYALEDIRAAEQRFRNYACRCHAKHCDRYFVAVLRDVSDKGRQHRAGIREEQRRNHARKEDLNKVIDERRQLAENPAEQILSGLDGIAVQWCPSSGGLIARGRGLGRANLLAGLRKFLANTTLTEDAATTIWRRWYNGKKLDPKAVQAVKRVFDRAVQAILLEEGLTPTGGVMQFVKGAKSAPERSPSRVILRNKPATPAGS